MNLITMLKPYSAAAPRISGRPNTLPMLNWRSKKDISPKVHTITSPSGSSASSVSRTRLGVRAAARGPLGHEAVRARAVPDIDRGLDLQEEPARRADELVPDLLRNVVEADLRRRRVRLQALEVVHEVPVDLRLEVGQGGPAHLTVGLAELDDEQLDPVPYPREPGLGVPLGRSEEHTSELQSQSNLLFPLL